MLKSAFAVALVATFGAIGAPDTANASQISSAEDGARKVNISGRQRMLSQRMAKAVCFSGLGVEPDMHKQMALDARDLFDRSLAGLINGDADLGILPETDPQARLQLAYVSETWSGFGPSVEAALNAGGESAAEVVRSQNVKLLQQSNAAVSALVVAHGSGALAADVAIAINIAGRQRMLSQRMAKEYCEVAAGGENSEAARTNLAETMALFEASHVSLRDGNPMDKIVSPPTAEISAKLKEVEALWTELKPVIEAVVNGSTPTAEGLALVAENNNPLLRTMNEAVGLYEGA